MLFRSENHYFTGVSGSDEDRIATYASAIASAAERIAESLGEPVYVKRGDAYGSPLGAGSPAAKLLGAAAVGLLGYVAWKRRLPQRALAAARSFW